MQKLIVTCLISEFCIPFLIQRIIVVKSPQYKLWPTSRLDAMPTDLKNFTSIGRENCFEIRRQQDKVCYILIFSILHWKISKLDDRVEEKA